MPKASISQLGSSGVICLAGLVANWSWRQWYTAGGWLRRIQNQNRWSLLPKSISGPVNPEQEKQLTISLAATEICFGSAGTKMTMPELREALAAQNLRARKPDKRIVILDSAADVPYGRYFKVVMAVSDAGGVLALLEEE